MSSAACPARQTTTLVVPPPISTFMIAPAVADRATAPEPWAAMVASRLSPALTATKRPASAANRSPMARALSRSKATPVRIRAPVSTCSRVSPAAWYCWSTNTPRAAPSIFVAPEYGVSKMSDWYSTSRLTVTYRPSWRSSSSREKSRCEVDEPMSTPTLVRTMRSSSAMSRPGAVKLKGLLSLGKEGRRRLRNG